jgi:glycosyltransferase involved in cell wall biosynthesis
MTRKSPAVMSIAIDMTAMSPEYLGGVSRYSLSLISAILNQNQRNITIICTSKNYDFFQSKLPPQTKLMPLDLRENLLIRALEFFAFRIYPSTTILQLAQNLRYSEFITRYAQDYQLIYTPTTYSNFTSSIPNSLVSLHDTQEMKFPKFFNSKEIRYRKVRVKTTLKFSTSIQVSSNFIEKELMNYFPVELDGKYIIVIPEGVDTKYFKQLEERRVNKHLSIFYPAGFLEHKNHDYLFKALELVPEEFTFSVKLTGEPNRYIDNLMNKTTDLVRSRLVITGRLSDSQLLEEYQKCDAVICCSKYESSSLPILEGLSCGAIALASDIPAHCEMAKVMPITLFGLENPESLASILIQLLRKGLGGFQTVSFRNFSAERDWSVIASKYLDHFEEVTLENFK